MKKGLLLLATTLLMLTGCSKEEDNCTQKVYKKVYKDGGVEWVLINSGSWQGPEQYKNYTKTIKYEDGSFDVIKTVVTCD
jgi:protein involved in sex pheromone biosynthesis